MGVKKHKRIANFSNELTQLESHDICPMHLFSQKDNDDDNDNERMKNTDILQYLNLEIVRPISSTMS